MSSLYILKSQMNSLTQAESFLKNRKWIVGSGINLREALAFIIQRQPKYIMITADHPNKKVRALPKMLIQAFPAKIIGFSEKGNSQSTKNLHDMNLEYNLYPPVSGPAIERMVLKIKKDDENKELQAKEKASLTKAAGENLDQFITFKGDTASGDSLKASFDQARIALSQLVNSEGAQEGSAAADTALQTSEFDDFGNIINPQGPANKGGLAYNPLDAGQLTNDNTNGSGYIPDQSSNTDPNSPNYTDSGPIGGGYSRFGAQKKKDTKNNSHNSTAADQQTDYSDSQSSDPNSPNYTDSGSTSGGPIVGGYGANRKKSKTKKNSPEIDREADDTEESENSTESSDSGPIGGGYAANRKKTKNARGSNDTSSNSDSDSETSTDQGRDSSGFMDGKSAWEKADDNNPSDNANKAETQRKRATNQGSDAGLVGSDSDGSPNNPSALKKTSYGYGKNKEKLPYSFTTEHEKKNPQGLQSIIVKGAHVALQETANLEGVEAAKRIEKSSDIACITVESPRFSGYLVCAFGRNRRVDKSLIDLLKERLIKFLKDNGEELKDQDTMSLNITEIDFTAWTLSQAEFLKKSVHEGDEIAIAFFPATIRDPELSASISEKMVQIKLDDLKENARVEFDLYIFMPENNKYLLYTPQGHAFYEKQKDRLKEKGITHMHLRKEASHEVKRYQAQNFLNDKIASFAKPTDQSA